MFVVANFINALANMINFVLGAYMWVIVGRAIISWVNPDPYNPIVRFLHDVTEPLLSRIRRFIQELGDLYLLRLLLVWTFHQ
jgi:YggT family protein